MHAEIIMLRLDFTNLLKYYNKMNKIFLFFAT